MKTIFRITTLLIGLAGASAPALSQTAVPPPMPAYPPLSSAQLDRLLGPIALYSDPLIAEILPASTLPTEIVLADRYLGGGGDPGQIDEQAWDASVQALAHYPEILKWMDDNLDWTTELGQAFLNQQQDVMDSIQRLRSTAFYLGSLRSTPQQQVVNDGGYIEILPAEPEVIYVPVYQPGAVYYRAAYGAPFITFGRGWRIGVWLHDDFDWNHHNLIVWNHDRPRPADWWRERPDQRAIVIANHTAVWHPFNRPAMAVANWGDRGWDNRAPSAPVPNQPPMLPQPPRNEPANNMPQPAPHRGANRFTPAPGQHFQAANPAPANGAFIGIQSARDARSYGERGQQSLRTITRPAPASRPAPSSGRNSGRAGR